MIPAWVTFAALLFVVTGCAVALVVLTDRARRDERERGFRHLDHALGLSRDLTAIVERAGRERVAAAEALVASMRVDAVEAEEAHRAAMRELAAAHRAELDALVNRLTIGTDRPATPEIMHHEDPETIARRQIHLDTVKNGMEQMRRAYKDAGIDRTDDELREEVEDMLAGAGVVHRFEPHGDLAAMVRD